MIKTLAELVKSSVTHISTERPNNPLIGSVYYDNNKGITCLFNGYIWVELVTWKKNRNLKRKKMIKNTFDF